MVWLRGPYMMSVIKPRSGAYKANDLTLSYLSNTQSSLFQYWPPACHSTPKEFSLIIRTYCWLSTRTPINTEGHVPVHLPSAGPLLTILTGVSLPQSSKDTLYCRAGHFWDLCWLLTTWGKLHSLSQQIFPLPSGDNLAEDPHHFKTWVIS